MEIHEYLHEIEVKIKIISWSESIHEKQCKISGYCPFRILLILTIQVFLRYTSTTT